MSSLDLVLHGGEVLDGSGRPPIRADVGVAGGRIAEVGDLRGRATARRIAVDGLAIAPGLIDLHAHSDLALLADPAWEVKLLQGVTTEVVGQDGLGLAPATELTKAILADELEAWNGTVPGSAWDWTSVDSYLRRIEALGVAPNVAVLAPHGTIRLNVIGHDDRPPTDTELAAMQAEVVRACDEGAVGLSTGLTYAPAQFADVDELVALAAAMPQGYFAPHLRNYGAGVLAATEEALEVGRRAGVPVHLTHAQLPFAVNRERAPELLGLVDRAREAGQDVTMDSYPYAAGATQLHAFLPGWVRDGGRAGMRARLQEPDARASIAQEMERGSDGLHGMPVDWSLLVVASAGSPLGAAAVGRSVAAAAAAVGRPPFAFYCELLLAEDFRAGAVLHVGNEETLRAIIAHPQQMGGSDGIVVGDRPHPRAWGTFARLLGPCVRDLGLATLAEMVRKLTSAPARRLGLPDRGIVRPGYAADLVCFDPHTVADRATYEEPRRPPVGIEHVVVNGVLVVDGGHHTGALPGRALRRDRP